MVCPGWAHNGAYKQTEESCRSYCCGDPECAGYHFKLPNECFIGADTTTCIKDTTGATRTGGVRPVPALIPTPAPNGPHTAKFDDSSWREISLPHDFVVEQPPAAAEEESHGYRPKNVSWYRLHFELGAESAAAATWLEFGGVFRASDAWLNGQHLGHHSSGYTSFRYPLTAAAGAGGNASGAVAGTNVLALRVDPFADEGWWYEGGGIYRPVDIVTVADGGAHVVPEGVYAPASVTGAIDRSGAWPPTADANVAIETELASDGDGNVTLASEIFNAAGSSVWASEVVAAGAGTVVLRQNATLRSALLWEPAPASSAGADSHLYTLVSTVRRNGRATDAVNTTFGVRQAVFSPSEGLVLNGRNVKVRGMCAHQDFAGVGTAMPPRIQDFRVRTLQSFGANAWRMSHNPPDAALLDSADRRGMLIWDENRMFGNYTPWLADQADLIRRDRNHPSIIWWSLCNEYGCKQEPAGIPPMNGTLATGQRFIDLIKRLDSTRAVSGAWSGGDDADGFRWSQLDGLDVMGFNYDYAVYDKFHAAFPDKPLISSESCSCHADRSSAVNSTLGLLGEFTAWPCIRDCWQPTAQRAFVAGSFDWTGFDYRGEPTPSVWPVTNSHFGVVDLAGYLKSPAYYYKSQFEPDTPVLHITPHMWDYDEVPPAPHGSLLSLECNAAGVAGGALGAGDPQGWDLPITGNPGLVQSRSSPGECLTAAATAYPGTTAACNASDPRQLLAWRNASTTTGAVGGALANDATNLCLNVYGGTGPNIAFFKCTGQDDEVFWYDTRSGQLQELAAGVNTSCVSYTDGTEKQVWAYTNADEVELFRNGVSQGRQAIEPFGKGTWSVPFEPGNLTAIAYRGGKRWAQDAVVTAGAPAALALRVDAPLAGEAPLRADGVDVALLTASVLDAAGNVVHAGAANDGTGPDVTFSVAGSGVLLGAGNGDPSDHTAEGRTGSQSRHAWNGLVRAIVQATVVPFETGEITVTATARGLQSATLTLRSVSI
eukprot:g6769.t1